MATNIPLVDLGAQHRQVADEIARGFSKVLENTSFILGAEVKAFEDAFAAFTGAKHCVGVGNGTDALELALRAAGVGPGDEVIIPTNTFIATPLAAARAGATPVFVDCDPETYLLDVEQVAAKITKRTRAIMPVDLYGQVAPMERLSPLVEKHGLKVIEDAAQAQGAKRNGKGAGTFGDAAGTSFYPGKNLGAYGDAGAVLTSSDELAGKVRALRNYGSNVKYHHPETGFNSRLDTLQAVVLLAKLQRLPAWNQGRREAAARYDELLAQAALPGVVAPRTLAGNEPIFHLYVVRVPRRDEVLKKLNADGIGAGIHYPVPCHLQGAFKHLGLGPGSFPVAEKAAAEIVSLPMYGEITAEQQARVVESLRKALA
ncbi:MAG TPA: DegT/DnrJ/EryC1/StrS family aminotransferase [Polyangia bacterium]|nr:DegT/DnrJ/EryC1/StrS family aminotransferase [Polyangia bacterium]